MISTGYDIDMAACLWQPDTLHDMVACLWLPDIRGDMVTYLGKPESGRRYGRWSVDMVDGTSIWLVGVDMEAEYNTRHDVNIGMALDEGYRHGGFWWTSTQFFFLGILAC